MGEARIDHASRARWTHYLTLDVVRLVQNLLGGGEMQRDRIQIAELELRQADLIRRRQEVAEGLGRDVIRLVLRWERLERDVELLDSQLLTRCRWVSSWRRGTEPGAVPPPQC